MPRSVQIRTNRLVDPDRTHIFDADSGVEIRDVESFAIVANTVSGRPNAVQLVRVESSIVAGVRRTREYAHLSDLVIVDDGVFSEGSGYVRP